MKLLNAIQPPAHVGIFEFFALLTLTIPGVSAPQSLGAADATGVTIVKQDAGFLFQEGESKIMFYQLVPKSNGGKFERANYIHPLYDLRGNVLTEDSPKDHPHHRGVFWAWHYLSVDGRTGADCWALENWAWEPAQTRVLASGGDAAALQTVTIWKSPLFKNAQGELAPLLKETAVIRAHSKTGRQRLIDFDLRFLALQPRMRLAGSQDEKGYSGFSVRLRLPKDVQFYGRAGQLTPRNTVVEAGPWMDALGSFDPGGAVGGVAVLGHPSNPGAPQPWILRRQGSAQNAAYPGREPIDLSTTQPLVLRYRLVIHEGALTAAELDDLQRQYEELRVES
jgi:hypothetical protein